MDNHNTWLDLFESFERHQTELEARDSLMVLSRDIQPKWEIQAFVFKELGEVIVSLESAEGFLVHGFGFWCRGMDRTSTRPAFPSWVLYGFQPERGTAQASGSPTVINLA